MGEKYSAIRMDDAGEVDDVAISADMFRLERMTDDSWWACASRGKERVAFSIYRKGKEVVVKVIEDSIGCKDDSGRARAEAEK